MIDDDDKMERLEKDDAFYEARQSGNQARRERMQQQQELSEAQKRSRDEIASNKAASDNLVSIVEELRKRQANG